MIECISEHVPRLQLQCSLGYTVLCPYKLYSLNNLHLSPKTLIYLKESITLSIYTEIEKEIEVCVCMTGHITKQLATLSLLFLYLVGKASVNYGKINFQRECLFPRSVCKKINHQYQLSLVSWHFGVVIILHQQLRKSCQGITLRRMGIFFLLANVNTPMCRCYNPSECVVWGLVSSL